MPPWRLVCTCFVVFCATSSLGNSGSSTDEILLFLLLPLLFDAVNGWCASENDPLWGNIHVSITLEIFFILHVVHHLYLFTGFVFWPVGFQNEFKFIFCCLYLHRVNWSIKQTFWTSMLLFKEKRTIIIDSKAWLHCNCAFIQKYFYQTSKNPFFEDTKILHFFS